jgi:polygalacturonase
MNGNEGMIQRRGASQAATFVVAASDSSHPGRADYVCSGVDDQITIQAAIAALPDNGGKVVLLEGNYAVNRKSDSNYYTIGIPSNVEFEMLKGAVITLNANQN